MNQGEMKLEHVFVCRMTGEGQVFEGELPDEEKQSILEFARYVEAKRVGDRLAQEQRTEELPW